MRNESWSYTWEHIPSKKTGIRTIHFGHVYASNRHVTGEASFKDFLKWCNGQNPSVWVYRDIPATKIQNKSAFSAISLKLAESLVPYVTDEDVNLSRLEFLETVADRILSDIADEIK